MRCSVSNHEVWNEIGNLYFMKGAYEPAIHAYLRSIQLDNKFGRSYSNLALAFVHTGKYIDAIKLYRHSIDLLPDMKERAITWNRLGILYRQIRDYKKALEAYQQADILDPQQEDTSYEATLPLTVSMPAIDINSILNENMFGVEVAENSPPKEVNTNLISTQAQVIPYLLDDGLILLDPEQIRRAVEDQRQTVDIPLGEDNKQNSANLHDKELPENPFSTEEVNMFEVITDSKNESEQNEKKKLSILFQNQLLKNLSQLNLISLNTRPKQ